MPRANDHTGKTYGKLTGIRFTGYRQSRGGAKKRLWLWRCACGNRKVIKGEHVSRGHVKSCGCLQPNKGDMAVAYAIFGNYRDGDLTFEDFLHLSQRDCFYCGKAPSQTRRGRNKSEASYTYNGLDRLMSDRGHDRDNVVPCCWFCNETKGDTPFPVFLEWIQTLAGRLLPRRSAILGASECVDGDDDT